MHSYPVDNVLFVADSYKISHYKQNPPDTQLVYSYFESRGGAFKETCFFGLQYILKRWLSGCVVTREMVLKAKQFYALHFGLADVFNEQGWMHIVEKHGGKLPLLIKAVAEGTVVPTHNVLFTVENTDPVVPWLTNWFETLLLQLWYPVTVCTLSREIKKEICQYLRETSDSVDSLKFQLHDFGYRGCTSVEAAAIGDAAHLVNFQGTDTIAGICLLQKYYDCEMAGFSIPAAEHSTITVWGREHELDACRNMLEKFPRCAVSVVSDSFNVYDCVRNIWGGQLRELVTQRAAGCPLVIRPDSGNPVDVVCKVLDILEQLFPCSLNSKGFKVLPAYLRIIQGDGINQKSIGEILAALKKKGWSADVIVFGCGGSLLQRVNRDTLQIAFKCSFAVVNGKPRDVYKDPETDHSKKSKQGRLTLEKRDGLYVTVENGQGDPAKDLLQVVFENGELKREWSLEEVRQRAQLPELL